MIGCAQPKSPNPDPPLSTRSTRLRLSTRSTKSRSTFKHRADLPTPGPFFDLGAVKFCFHHSPSIQQGRELLGLASIPLVLAYPLLVLVHQQWTSLFWWDRPCRGLFSFPRMDAADSRPQNLHCPLCFKPLGWVFGFYQSSFKIRLLQTPKDLVVSQGAFSFCPCSEEYR